MDHSSTKHYTFNFRDILLDEIALDGLEGINLDLLWRRIERRVSSPVTQKMKIRFWGFLTNNEAISFYKVPEPLSRIELDDRFLRIYPKTGQLLDTPEYIDGPYEYHPVNDEYGSCIHYDTRKRISRDQLKTLSYERVVERYGDTLVMVASIEERWNSLASHKPIAELKCLSPTHYCILELVGRARENGQMTVGKTNLSKISSDSKLLFYNRKFLQDADLLKVQAVSLVVNDKAAKSLLLRLKRFHAPPVFSLPKVGKIHDILQHLSLQPDHSDMIETLIEKGIVNQTDCKRLSKNGFLYVDLREVFNEKKNKNVTKRFVSLNIVSDESSQSDEENNEEPLKCQYRIKVNLLRQAYQLIVESGVKGHTMIEIAQLLGIEFYMARMILRVFKKKNIVREFYVDKGKVRVARYIAISVAAHQNSATYEEEKKKFIENVNRSQTATKNKLTSDVKTEECDTEIPRKKIKLEYGSSTGYDNIISVDHPIEKGITEMKLLDETKQTKNLFTEKNATLRQLKFANGIIKMLKEHQVICGLQPLNLMVSKEIKESPMDLKSLRTFVQSLATQGQLRILKMEWPGSSNKYSVVICTPEVKITDPKIKAKYKEIYIKSMKTKKVKLVKQVNEKRPLSLFCYNRYTKIQKLHEVLMKIVYFNEDDTYHSNLPEGFSSLVEIMPEFSVEFAVGISSLGTLSKIPLAKLPLNIFPLKLKNAPSEVFTMFLKSSSLETQCTANLRLLAMLGLVQMIEDPQNDGCKTYISHMFYINRRAKIIDTTGVWPREVDENGLEASEKSYYFESFHDVEKYWADVYIISLSTTIQVEPNTRYRKTTPKLSRPKEEVANNDNGQVLGDGLGPCGFDSSFFLDIPRLWSDPNTRVSHKKSANSTSKESKPKTIKKPKAIRKRKAFIVKAAVKKKPSSATKKRRSPKLKWTPIEDKCIMLCKAALTVFSPVAQPGSLTLRNLVARDILSMIDIKNQIKFIHKRAEMLNSDSTLSYEQECLVNDIKHRPQIMIKYENQFKVLKEKHSNNLNKTIAAARLPLMELVWTMLQLVQSDSFQRKVPCVAANIEEFHKSFTIYPSNANKSYNWYRTPPDSDPNLAAVKEGIMFCLVASHGVGMSSDIAAAIHSLFNTCPETRMRPAIEELRKSGAVTARDKTLALSETFKYHYHVAFNSSYKVSKKYQRQWDNRLNSDFFEILTDIINKKMPQSGLNGSPEMNCALLEMNSCGVVDIVNETTPVISSASNTPAQDEYVSVGDIIMNYNLKSGTMGWRNKSEIKIFSELYKNLDFNDAYNDVIRSAQLGTEDTNIDGDEKIVSYLKKKKESGATFSELQDITGYNVDTLKSKLMVLESSETVKPLGYFENIIVLTEYAEPWTLPLNGDRVVPTAWLTFDKDVNTDIFAKWAGLIVDKVFKYPGSSIAYLSESCEFVSTRAVQEVCTVLEKFKCVKLATINVSEPDLFSNDDTVPELTDFNPYAAVDSILVFPVKDSLTRFTYIRKKLSRDENHYNSDDVDSDDN